MKTQKLIDKLKKKIDKYNHRGDDAVKEETKQKYYDMADMAQEKLVSLQLKGGSCGKS